jgi:hypothetical protein
MNPPLVTLWQAKPPLQIEVSRRQEISWTLQSSIATLAEWEN